MPIRKELRHLYHGPAWRKIRDRILARAGNRCERCGKPNCAQLQVTRRGIWYDVRCNAWLNDKGKSSAFNWPGLTKLSVYTIRCVLTIAHLDHNPHNNSDENLQALCQHCHLKHDRHFHFANARRTKAARFQQGWLSAEIEHGVRHE